MINRINPMQTANVLKQYKAQTENIKEYHQEKMYNLVQPFTVADLITKLTYMAAKGQVNLNDLVYVDGDNPATRIFVSNSKISIK